tara:strand:+ start:296 stop:514 length:219 start_codon:yes stop_codon:yes gene_type:complete
MFLLNLHKNNYMFSKGQIIFGIIFFVVFSIVIAYTYRKDLKLHKRFYAGSVWVLIAFIAFILFITAIKFIFK